MAETLVRLVDENTIVVVEGNDILTELATRAETAADEAEDSAAQAVLSAASASDSAASATNANGQAQTAAAEADSTHDAIVAILASETITTGFQYQPQSRATLALISGQSAGATAYLGEDGRQGVFVWRVGNYAANVTADLWQGIYVAPAASTGLADDGSDGAWVRQTAGNEGYASWFGAKAVNADNKVPIQAALNHPQLYTIKLDAEDYWLKSQVIVPTEKHFRGANRDATTLKLASDYVSAGGLSDIGGNKGHFFVTCENTASGVRVSDMTIDGNKVGAPTPTDTRKHMCPMQGTGWVVERLHIKNSSGYQCYARGDPGARCSKGVYRDIICENGETQLETTYADDILFDHCITGDGDGDITAAEAWIPWAGSRRITYRDCRHYGVAGAGLNILADVDDIEVTVENCNIEITSETFALITSGANTVYLKMSNSRFAAGTTGGAGATWGSVQAKLNNCEFIGSVGSVIKDRADIVAVECDSIGTNTAYGALFPDMADVPRIRWYGGSLISTIPEAYNVDVRGIYVSPETVVSPLLASGRYPKGTAQVFTAGDANITVTAKAAGYYYIEKTAADGVQSWAETPLALDGPFVITIIPEGAEGWSVVASDTPGTFDTDPYTHDAVIYQYGGEVYADGFVQIPLRSGWPMHIVRDEDDNVNYYLGGQTEEEGRLVRTVNKPGTFAAAFISVALNASAFVRVGKRN